MRKRSIGIFLFLLTVILLALNLSMTGAAIGTQTFVPLNLIAIAVFIIGLVLMARRDRNYAQEILDQRRFVDSPREYMSIARKMGYPLVEGYKEGTRVLNRDRKGVLTVIPNHKITNRGTCRSILEALATGEPNFRR